jgi:photosystem II stability/assembly factor-like uncharacterized protein
MDSLDSNKIYAAGFVGNNAAIARSTDLGKTWKTVITNAPSSYANICIDPMNYSILYASAIGLLKSTDSGQSWGSSGNTPSGKRIYSMDAAPHHLYTFMEDPVAERDTNFLYRSDDGGLSFRLKNQGLPTNNLYFVKVHPINSSVVFVGTSEGLFISNNDGENWLVSETAGLPPDRAIGAMAIPLSHPNQYFVSAAHGVFSFTNK